VWRRSPGGEADPAFGRRSVLAPGMVRMIAVGVLGGVVVMGIGVGSGVPALIVKVGRYPLHSGGVGAIRTLGRLGVPVFATVEDRLTPAALSRYCAGWFRWRVTGREPAEDLVGGLCQIGRRLGRRSVAVPVDDAAAVLIAEHADVLGEFFLFPRVAADLPRRLSSKHELYGLCRRHGVPAPESALLSTPAELAAFAAGAVFPVVVKDSDPWVRQRAPVVGGTTVLETPAELLALAGGLGGGAGLVVQEYLPMEEAEDWIVHLYCDTRSDCLVLFTGVKVRSWPLHTGATACGYAVPNPDLARLAARFCKEIGFQGVADLDWRLDRRDGRFKLVDFNPRMGNQFRLFENAAGTDVVRALYLDLTGRGVPAGSQLDGRRIVVEHIDVLARWGYRGSPYVTPSVPPGEVSTEWAWLAGDDPLPFVAMWPRLVKPLAACLTDRRRARRRCRLEARPGGRLGDGGRDSNLAKDGAR